MSKTLKTLENINRIKFSQLFNGGLAVDLDKTNETVTISFVSTMGIVSSKTLIQPTEIEVADALIEITDNAHESAKANLKEEGENLILKAITSESFRTPLAQNLTKSSKDVKIAKGIKQELLDEIANRKARKAALRQELKELG